MSTFGDERRSNPFVGDNPDINRSINKRRSRYEPSPGSSSSPAVSTRYASTPSADLVNLNDLDQKLWVALSCPTIGVEFDARTLALLDSDSDGHIRAPELLAAIDWAASTPE
jgi:hypothetical protein